MIHVGKISFHFKMADEQFAKGLYANWNEFCQSCFTKILEECLGKYALLSNKKGQFDL